MHCEQEGASSGSPCAIGLPLHGHALCRAPRNGMNAVQLKKQATNASAYPGLTDRACLSTSNFTLALLETERDLMHALESI